MAGSFDWLGSVPGIITAVATSAAAILAAFALWFSVRGRAPIMELELHPVGGPAAVYNATRHKFAKALVTVRNRWPHSIVVTSVVLRKPQAGVALFAYDPSSYTKPQNPVRDLQIKPVTVSPSEQEKAVFFVVLDEGVKRVSEPFEVDVKYQSLSGRVREHSRTLKNHIELGS